jgi:hypothetical protein
MVRFGTRRLRNVDTRPETSLPNVTAGDADMFVANSLLWSDFRRKRRSEIVSAVNHGICFANEALSVPPREQEGDPPQLE